MTDTTPTMLDNKGAAYVNRWPHSIARSARCSVEYVARALAEVTGQPVDQLAFSDETVVHPVVAALDGPTAKLVVARVNQMMAENRARRLTHCHYCGLELVRGECQECV